MSEHDGAWAARIIARFAREHIEAAVRVGDFSDPVHAQYLVDTLVQRQRLILQRYFSRLSPLSDVKVQAGELCATDLARKTASWPATAFQYSATLERATGRESVAVRAHVDGTVCVPLLATAATSLPEASAARYLTLTLRNGSSIGPLRVHMYDQGAARGLRVVGIERPRGGHER